MITLFTTRGRISRALCMVCALTFIAETWAPAAADLPAEPPISLDLTRPEPVAESPVALTPDLADARTEPSTLGLSPGQEIKIASAKSPDQALALSAMPKELLPGPSVSARTRSSRVPAALVAAGLLMIPLDKTLVKSIPRAEDPENAGAATEFVNNFGDIKVLLPVIGGLYLTGDKSTASEALTALINAGIMTEGLKRVTGRARPINSGDEGQFRGPGSPKEYQSFPSGHTSAAFAVATVLARKHPKQRWLYYGLASAVGYARIRKSAHFPSDVLVGAGVGMYAGNNAADHQGGLFTIRF